MNDHKNVFKETCKNIKTAIKIMDVTFDYDDIFILWLIWVMLSEMYFIVHLIDKLLKIDRPYKPKPKYLLNGKETRKY